jgi:hypothetical protein
MSSKSSSDSFDDFEYDSVQFITYTQEEMPVKDTTWGTRKGYQTIIIIAINMLVFALILRVTISKEIYELTLFIGGAFLVITSGCIGPYRYQPDKHVRLVRPKPESVVKGKIALAGFVSGEAIGKEVTLMVNGKTVAKLIPDQEVFIFMLNTVKEWSSDFVLLSAKVTVAGKEFTSEYSVYFDNTEDAVLSPHKGEIILEHERIYTPRPFRYGYLIMLIIVGFILMIISATL